MDTDAHGKWLVVGLGNPGARYEQTRHNAGFMVVDKLASVYDIRVKREECRALIGRALIGQAGPSPTKGGGGSVFTRLTHDSGQFPVLFADSNLQA